MFVSRGFWEMVFLEDMITTTVARHFIVISRLYITVYQLKPQAYTGQLVAR